MTRVVGKGLNEEWLCVLGWNEVSSRQIGEREGLEE